MKIGDTVYAMVDPDGHILGDGECTAISSEPFDKVDQDWVKRICREDKAKMIKVCIVPVDMVSGG